MKYFIFLFFIFSFNPRPKPTLYLIGDSTVKSGQGKGENDMWGWGSTLGNHFDTTKINIENHAIGGRSSRTFLTEGRWESILRKMGKGDFLMIQFGHNDDWAINDTIRARGTIRGISEDSVEINNLLTKKHEVVHSFGWYLRKYINEAKAKGVEVYVCSQIPFCRFQGEKIIRKPDYYPLWAKQVSEQTHAHFIDLHEITALKYDKLGYKQVKLKYFTPKDDVHTNANGAELNAQSVVFGLKKIPESNLSKYLL
jgi:lysophospholipase L1-like esterase